jgi:hypothetical protein
MNAFQSHDDKNPEDQAQRPHPEYVTSNTFSLTTLPQPKLARMKTLFCIAVIVALLYTLQINGLARCIKTLVMPNLRCRQCSNAQVARCRDSADTNGCLVNIVGCCTEATRSATNVRSTGDYSSQSPQYPASLDPVLSAEEEANEIVNNSAPEGEGILSTWLDKVAASDTKLAKAIPQASGEIAKVWSVCSQCLNSLIESCLMTTALDAPSKTYTPSSDVFHAADTYDCLVANGCCAEGGSEMDSKQKP